MSKKNKQKDGADKTSSRVHFIFFLICLAVLILGPVSVIWDFSGYVYILEIIGLVLIVICSIAIPFMIAYALSSLIPEKLKKKFLKASEKIMHPEKTEVKEKTNDETDKRPRVKDILSDESTDSITKLQQLTRLHDDGIINDDDYERLKMQVMENGIKSTD